MTETENPPTRDHDEDAKQRRLVAVHLQELEGNPLAPEQIAMFEMFDREDWPQERRLAYIKERARAAAEVGAVAE